MTLAQLRAQVQLKLGLDQTAASDEETLLDAWINAGVIDLLLRTKMNVNPGTMTTAVGEDDYTLSQAALAIQDLVYGTQQMQRVTVDDILRFRNASSVTGGTVRYYAFTGNDLFLFYPTPEEVATVTVYYVPRPDPLEQPDNDPSDELYGNIPSEYHKAIELYALAEAAEFTDHQPSGFGAAYRQQYEQKLVEVKRAMRHKAGRSLGPALLGRRRPLIGANDQYPRG